MSDDLRPEYCEVCDEWFIGRDHVQVTTYCEVCDAWFVGRDHVTVVEVPPA